MTPQGLGRDPSDHRQQRGANPAEPGVEIITGAENIIWTFSLQYTAAGTVPARNHGPETGPNLLFLDLAGMPGGEGA